MTKHAVMTILGALIVVVAIGGFPAWARTTLLVAGGIAISVLSYLSSVVYCSNCKKLISDVERETYESPFVGSSRGANIVPSYIEDAEQALPGYSEDKSVMPQKIQ